MLKLSLYKSHAAVIAVAIIIGLLTGSGAAVATTAAINGQRIVQGTISEGKLTHDLRQEIDKIGLSASNAALNGVSRQIMEQTSFAIRDLEKRIEKEYVRRP